MSFRCLLIGDGSLLVECGTLLLARGYRIEAVVTTNDSIIEWAREIEAEVVPPGARSVDALAGRKFDWIFSIANLSLIPAALWQSATQGAVNFHDSLLPRYAGLNAPAWALLAGETTHGVTWHAITDGIDEGDIYLQRSIDIDEDETALTLNAKCFEAGMASFADLIDQIQAGTTQRLVQTPDKRTYCGRHDRPDDAATLDFTRTTAEIDRVARALNFGQGYPNPLALPKIRTKSGVYFVRGLEKSATMADEAPGTVTAAGEDGVTISTMDGAVHIQALVDHAGAVIEPATALSVGDKLIPLTEEERVGLRAFAAQSTRHETWFAERLRAGRVPSVYGALPRSRAVPPDYRSFELPALSGRQEPSAVAAIAAYFIRLGEPSPLRFGYVNDRCAADARDLAGFVAPVLPLVLDGAADVSCEALSAAVAKEIASLVERRGHVADLIPRYPNLAVEPFTVVIDTAADAGRAPATTGSPLVFAIGATSASLQVDMAQMPVRMCDLLLDRLDTCFRDFFADESKRVSDLDILPKAEKDVALYQDNATTVEFDRSALVHGLIEAQAARSPDAIAVVCEDRSLTYRELNLQADRVAEKLVALGAGPDAIVGLYLNRSCELVIGALAILKAGGAYLPLDPGYPADRLAYMIEDSGLTLILSQQGLTTPSKPDHVRVVGIEDALASGGGAAPPGDTSAGNLAYVIYTSGSTGRPKGVMIEHRNVVNFFTGMDARVPRSREGQDVWLAVTSLSFDISVLELFWTLARGFKVVIQTDRRHAPDRQKPRANGTDFSLFFWGNDDAAGPGKYKLLLDSARYADSRGFRAVWTPERHFHAFGGPFPNPSVTGAAVAAITSNLDIRAGSCVLPLHHPARVVEEWGVIDNLSNGRAGIAFASGWMPEDFLLRPENAPPHNKKAMVRDIQTVRSLWRGEGVEFETPDGKKVRVVTQPRPVSSELPIWITTAGNPDTYREAAKLGANVLTHLLGQSIAEVGEKIAIYRETLRETGRNPSDYTVTLMLHTLIGEDREQVRDVAREPMKAYLRSAVALIKQFAWAFPAFKRPAGSTNAVDIDLQSLDPEELDAIVEFAFLRYFDDSGLFGTVQDALARVEQVKAIGVDEIACLIDFGVPSAAAMQALEPLAKVVAAANAGEDTSPSPGDISIGGLIRSHQVTHLQFTPSMAAMLLMDEDTRSALKDVRHLFIGGEALKAALVDELRGVTDATISNMYGPTETTIWSATLAVGDRPDAVVPLGAPIANTQLYVLDQAQRPVPEGQPGELFIGGEGVARGYLGRPELTEERFLRNPFTDSGRMYRTGDLVRRDEHGAIQFIGRADHQVKVRGYRIELGEIEAHLAAHPSIAEAVVVVREDRPNDVRIVAYVRPKAGTVSDEALRGHVREKLPDYMMPAHFITLQKFPLTPNAKIDRARLPKPGDGAGPRKPAPVAHQPVTAAGADAAQSITEAFKRVLGVENVGRNDNFFSLGGHSLLAVQVHRDLKVSVSAEITITDIYRFPTVAGLAAHLTNRGGAKGQLSQVASRAAARRNALASRLGRPSS